MSDHPHAAKQETEKPTPETMEGWYVLHDCYTVDWAAWRTIPSAERSAALDELRDWLAQARGSERGDSAAYVVTGQKAELMFLHYKTTPGSLNTVRKNLLRCRISDFFKPAYGYLSIVEVSLYEATARAHGTLARQGMRPGGEGWEAAFEAELSEQKNHLEARCFRSIPEKRYVCFYPMNKRRGEHENWYTLSLDDRRALMRGHGRLGHKYAEEVTQVISGSIGLDDWEWGVDLHADDPLVFKKLIYDMRFDPVSAKYAEFGAFYIGKYSSDDQLVAYLEL